MYNYTLSQLSNIVVYSAYSISGSSQTSSWGLLLANWLHIPSLHKKPIEANKFVRSCGLSMMDWNIADPNTRCRCRTVANISLAGALDWTTATLCDDCLSSLGPQSQVMWNWKIIRRRFTRDTQEWIRAFNRASCQPFHRDRSIDRLFETTTDALISVEFHRDFFWHCITC